MSSTYRNNDLHRMFSFKLTGVGCIIAFVTSPEGTRLAAATDRGSIVFYDTRISHHQVHINILPGNEAASIDNPSEVETKLAWTTDSQLIFSGNEGHLYYINLTHGTMDKPPIVHVSYGFQYYAGRITFLAYDIRTRTLVVAYDYFVTIWSSAPGDQAFKLIDRIEPKQSGISQLISPFTIQFIRCANREIFIAGPFGYILWSGPGRALTRWVGPSLAAIGTSAVSPCTGDLVVTTFNHEVLRWPIGLNGDALGDIVAPVAAGRYRFDDLRPDTSPTITSNDVIFLAQENHIVMVCPGGNILQEVKLHNHTLRGIQTWGDQVYLALDGLDGEVIFMALTIKKGSQLKLQELRRIRNLEPGSLTKISYLEVDLNEISTVVIERISTRTSQIIKDPKHTHPELNTLIFSTFYIGVHDVSTFVCIAFALIPKDSSTLGKVVLLAQNDDENTITRWLAADRGFTSKLVAQLIQWVQRLE